MAIRKGKGLSGSIGKQVHRKWRKLDIVQSRPGRGGVKQTEETKKASQLFGASSRLAFGIRMMLSNFIIPYFDGSSHNRRTSLIKSILEKCFNKENLTCRVNENSFDRLNGYEFNASSALTRSMKVIPESSYQNGTVTVTFPKLINNQEFIFPEDTESCIITIGAGAYRLEDQSLSADFKPHSFGVTQQQQLIESQNFTFAVPNGCLCIIGITLHYYHDSKYGKSRINHKLFNPAAICGAFLTPGTFDKDLSREWEEPSPIKENTFKVTFDRSATTDQASLRSQP